MSSSYKIGVDGGGTKTECILVDPTGTIVARLLAPGCNPSIVGPDQARLIITDALCTVVQSAFGNQREAAISSTHIYAAGNRVFWRETGATLTGFGRVVTADDSYPVLELATHGQPGIVLHGGTGSFVAARGLDGALHYAGGLGWRFGDAGSGYDIGRRAIVRALLEAQNCVAPSSLGALVCEHAGLSRGAEAHAITHFFYHHAEPNRMIAGLAPAV